GVFLRSGRPCRAGGGWPTVFSPGPSSPFCSWGPGVCGLPTWRKWPLTWGRWFFHPAPPPRRRGTGVSTTRTSTTTTTSTTSTTSTGSTTMIVVTVAPTTIGEPRSSTTTVDTVRTPRSTPATEDGPTTTHGLEGLAGEG